MSKIAIISQPNEGVLIDVSGCTDLKEALEHLSSTLQVSSQFWQDLNVSINLGKLKLDSSEAAQILAIAKGVGITPSAVYTKDSDTKVALIDNGVNLGEGKPMSLPEINLNTDNIDSAEVVETGPEKPKSTVAKLKLRVADALKKRKGEDVAEVNTLETVETETSQSPEFAENEKNIRETITNRIIHLQNEAEANSDSTPVTVALTASEEAIDEAVEQVETELEVTTETTMEMASTTNSSEIVQADQIETSESDDGVVDAMDDITESEEAEQDLEEEASVETESEVMEEENPEAIEEVIEDEVQEEEVEVTKTENLVVRPKVGGTMYLRQNLRSGQTVSHKGHLIIIGDVNPGAEVMAEGDITIWGSLRGIAHAGIGGNVESEIRALNLQPIQIRIAHAIARAPDKPRMKYSSSHGPETARIVAGKIRVFRSRLE